MKSWIAATALALALTGPALADQCAWLDKDQTAKLQGLIDKNFDGAPGLISYCASCGDTEAKGLAFKEGVKIAIKKEDDTYSSFSYEDEALDAAYLYVPAEKGEPPFKGAKSLSSLIGCEDDTPDAIDIGKDGKVTESK